MAWTKEQTDAINLDHNNIIVSAGAGSGKTAVLTERVLRKIKSGVHIDELLIMTFTNAAAKEMKDRIRKKLKKENMISELDLIDSAYITTFDSFSLSIVKKYHYLLGLDRNVGISDDALINIYKKKLMDEIFDEYYASGSIEFKHFIKDFCYKDDEQLKALLLKISDKLDMKIDKKKYLNTYLDTYYKDEFIDKAISSYFDVIEKYKSYIEEDIKNLSLYLDSKYMERLNQVINPLLKARDYDEVVKSIEFRLPNIDKDADTEAKNIKKEISSIVTNIKSLCVYENTEQIREEILSTKSNMGLIIEILNLFDNNFSKIKQENNMYSFNDISRFAIKIVEENLSVRDELTNKFNEIMVDEYQDTNDIQEYFVSLISKNNVYMVGDIKQSIYRFRNANPNIFKNKYDLYANTDSGIKIDLLKNFRSRKEVLDNINLVFNNLMFDDLGGADYRKSHQMVFGNNTYIEEGKTNQNYDFEILTYKKEDTKFSDTEKEIFAIGKDIKEKIENNYLIFDKDMLILRKAEYSDFVILLDRTRDFDLYKKVFEYLGIPLTLYKDEEIKSSSDILIIKNILKLEEAIDKESFDNSFKYAYLSLGRSFLFELSDEELFHTIKTGNYKDTIIYKKCEELYNYYYEVSPKVFFLKLLEIFNYEENLLKLTDVKVGRVRLEYFYNLLNDFESNGMTISDFVDYLENIFENDTKKTFSLNTSESNSVKIMTIHKSKGLEYPVCYFAGFTKKFSFRELNDSILFSNKYGLIIPYFNNYQKDTIYKTLLKLDTKEEELSEKIRLLYVALTRAKEKMIIVMPEFDSEKLIENPSNYQKNMMTSFKDMMYFTYNYIEEYIKKIEVDCTKDYLINKSSSDNNSLLVEDNLRVLEKSFSKEVLKEEHFSKNVVSLNSLEDISKMKLGTKIHEIFELIDFNNPDYDVISNKEKELVEAFLNQKIIKDNLNSKMYKEYEFIYQKDNEFKTGIIDLMIENTDTIIIIDYKLKNVLDDAYTKQLEGYREAISKRTNKKIELYLYSILDKELKPIS